MAEAIVTVLAFAFVAGLIVTIIGIVRGFRQKRWLLAIIAGSITCVLLVAFTVVGESTGLLDEPTPAAQPVTAPIPDPTPIPVGGLGISRDAIHAVLTSSFEYGNVREESCPLSACTSIESPNPNVKIFVFGEDDNVYRVLVSGDTLDNDFDTGMAMAFLAELVMPDYRDAVIDWLSEDAFTEVERKGWGLETTVIGGRSLELAVSRSSGKLSFSISE